MEEKTIYRIVGYAKTDARYDTDDSVKFVGERVILGNGRWIGPWWHGTTRLLDRKTPVENHTLLHHKVQLRRVSNETAQC